MTDEGSATGEKSSIGLAAARHRLARRCIKQSIIPVTIINIRSGDFHVRNKDIALAIYTPNRTMKTEGNSLR